MSIIIAERHGDYGLILADSYITRTTGSSHLTTDPASHALKLHALEDHFCIGFAGAYQMGADVVERISARYAGQFNSNKEWGTIVNDVYREILRKTGQPTDSVDFIVGWNGLNGLQFNVVRNGAVVRHHDRSGVPAYIGDADVFTAYKETRASLPTPSRNMAGGGELPVGIVEREKSKQAFAQVLRSRQHDTVGVLSPFGCSLTHEPEEGFMFPIGAEASQSSSEDRYSHATLVTIKGTRALAYFYRNLGKGFLFVSGKAAPVSLSTSTLAAFKQTVEAQFGITLLGSEWEPT